MRNEYNIQTSNNETQNEKRIDLEEPFEFSATIIKREQLISPDAFWNGMWIAAVDAPAGIWKRREKLLHI